MQFAVFLTRTSHARRFWRRRSFRNSAARALTSIHGFANLEHVYWLGYELAIEWGRFDPDRPDPQREAAKKRREVLRAQHMQDELVEALDPQIVVTRQQINDEH